MMEFLVVEGIVRFREVDLPPGRVDLRHLVRMLGGAGDVLRKDEVPIRPHRRVDAPADAGNPRSVFDAPLPDEVLRGQDDRRGAIARRTDVEPLDRPRHHLAVLDAVHGHVPVHLHREDPDQVRLQRAVEDRIPDVREDALRMRLARGHLLLVHDEYDVRETGSDVPPARDRAEDAGASAGEDARVRLAIAPGSIEQVLAFHRDAVEGIRRGPADDHVHIGAGEPGRIEGHLRRLEAHLLAGLLEAPPEERHAGPNDADFRHGPAPRTATAPVVLGTNRHDCATPTRTPSSCRTPAWPRSWRATSAARWSPVASNTFPHPRDPPETFTGKRPSAS